MEMQTFMCKRGRVEPESTVIIHIELNKTIFDTFREVCCPNGEKTVDMFESLMTRGVEHERTKEQAGSENRETH